MRASEIDIHELPSWLLANQPIATADRPNWYRLAAAGVGSCTRSPDIERLARINEIGEEQGAFTPDEVAIRQANLAARSVGDPPILPLDPDVAARRCLELLTLDRATAAEMSITWRMLPTSLIFELSRSKNLLQPVALQVPRIRSAALSRSAIEWCVLLPKLP